MTGVGQVPAPFLTACKIHDSICIVIRVWFAGDDWCRSGSGPLLVLTSVMVGLTSDSLDIEVPSPSSWLLRI